MRFERRGFHKKRREKGQGIRVDRVSDSPQAHIPQPCRLRRHHPLCNALAVQTNTTVHADIPACTAIGIIIGYVPAGAIAGGISCRADNNALRRLLITDARRWDIGLEYPAYRCIDGSRIFLAIVFLFRIKILNGQHLPREVFFGGI